MKIYFGIRSFSSFGRTDSQKIFSSLLYLFLEYFLIRQISLFTPKSTTFAWSYLPWNPHARSSIITLLKLHKVTGKTFLFEFKLKFHFFFFNWDSLHRKLNSHYEAWSYSKKKCKKIKACMKSVYKEPTVKIYSLLN